MQRTGGELVQDFLATFEIPYGFGNPGTTETTFLAAVAASKATYVLALHESSAVGIAAGYALVTGKPAVASLQTSLHVPFNAVPRRQTARSTKARSAGDRLLCDGETACTSTRRVAQLCLKGTRRPVATVGATTKSSAQ